MIVYATVRPETCDVRPGEQLDWASLGAYLREHLGSPDLKVGPTSNIEAASVAQFPGGHSNLTYLVRLGNIELVVRRPPLGPVAPKAHDMAREYRWLAAVHPIFPLAPRPFVLCEDTGVIGSVFYVMERRHGSVVRQEEPPQLVDNPAARRRASEGIVEALADLHGIDVTNGPIAALGKPAGFVARQVAGWRERWERAKTGDLPDMDCVLAWLAGHLPPDPERPAIVHGDFKLDNVMLDPDDVGRLVAVLDWEMSALGDPLVDLGIFLVYWTAADVGPVFRPGAGVTDALTTVTDRPGWFTRDEILDRYQQRTGRDVSSIAFYEVFALLKIAVVIQQIYVRYVRGQTDDARFAAFGDRVTSLARAAARLCT